MIFTAAIPKPAPGKISLNQCLLLYILKTPVAVAARYPATPYQGDESLYSCRKNSAATKAVAVCPDGNALVPKPSGRCTLVIFFKLYTDYITKNLAGKKINEAVKITDAKGKITYEAEVGKVDYLFYENEKFISKEEDNEDDEDDAR